MITSNGRLQVIGESERDKVASGCTNCRRCVEKCEFLQRYGTPGKICEQHHQLPAAEINPVFSCNLCSLCEELCPSKLPVVAAFHHIRSAEQKKSVQGKLVRLQVPAHRPVLRYEKIGSSPLFTLHRIPQGAKAVFFPGCTLAGTRSRITRHTMKALRKIHPECGLVLDCCAKISHDLGLVEKAEQQQTRLIEKLENAGIQRIITACSSCFVALSTLPSGLKVVSLYEELLEIHKPAQDQSGPVMTVHDACMTRNVSNIHNAVRELAKSAGVRIVEAAHTRDKTVCCGEGGSVLGVASDIGTSWQRIRRDEAAGRCILTYCAGCSEALGKDQQNIHLLDLLFDRHRALAGQHQQTSAPFTYFQRLALKLSYLLDRLK